MEEIQKYQVDSAIIESLVLQGDISKMNGQQKVEYYNWLCSSLGLNPATQPFQIIKFQGREQLYAKKDATEQLRKIYGVSVTELEKLFKDDLYIVTAKVSDKTGRADAATGAVSIKGLGGDNLANAIMKAETKAKRRATLSICGLGMLDESETDTIGRFETVNINTGEITSKSETVQSTRNYSEEAKDINTKEKFTIWLNTLSEDEKKDKLVKSVVENVKVRLISLFPEETIKNMKKNVHDSTILAIYKVIDEETNPERKKTLIDIFNDKVTKLELEKHKYEPLPFEK